MTTTAERQATFRERQRALGLVPVTVWVRPETKQDVLEMARRDREKVAHASCNVTSNTPS